MWRVKMEEFVDKPYEFVKDSMVRRLLHTLVVAFRRLIRLLAQRDRVAIILLYPY